MHFVHRHCPEAIMRPTSSRSGSEAVCMPVSRAPAGAPDCSQSWCCDPELGDWNDPNKPHTFADVPDC